MGGHHARSLQKSTWVFDITTSRIFCRHMKPKLSCLDGPWKPHADCETMGRRRHGLGHRRKNEFPSLLGQWGKPTTVCLPTEAQKRSCLTQKKIVSADLNPIGTLWDDLKRTIHNRRAKNTAEPKQFRQQQWSKIFLLTCASLNCSYAKCLVELLLPKEGQAVIKSKDPHTFPPCTWMFKCFVQ